eukprot:TRINITY_DN2953_c0_g1_i1.p1 TRINITY_DN2953_c0_g1~~TRINITY_DN2953_c0_g1_i1.p1  ORF type:complete len:418 (+),score=100.07 TRINITY_DN2953_c0_g1_i1:447-1700(+)
MIEKKRKTTETPANEGRTESKRITMSNESFPFSSLLEELQIIVISFLSRDEKLTLRRLNKDFYSILHKEFFNVTIKVLIKETTEEEILKDFKEKFRPLYMPVDQIPAVSVQADNYDIVVITPAIMKLFPRDIKSLDIRDCLSIELEAIAHLPPKLHTLEFEESPIPLESLPLFPKSIEKLRITTLSPRPSPTSPMKFPFTNLKFLHLRVDHLGWASGLHSLTEFELHLSDIHDGELKHLPPSLTTLALHSCKKLQSINYVPTQLTELRITYCHKLTNFKGIARCANLRRLTIFEVPISDDECYFPDRLEDLSLFFSTHKFPPMFLDAGTPARLEQLRKLFVFLAQQDAKEGFAKFIYPARLQELTLHEMPLPPVEMLPSKLRRIRISEKFLDTAQPLKEAMPKLSVEILECDRPKTK